MDRSQRSRIVEIILGIVFIGLGIFSLNRPIATLGVLVIWFGVFSIIRGIATLTGMGAYGDGKSRGVRLFIGIVDILIGFIFVANLAKGAFWLGIFFAVWFFVESIGNLFLTARFSKRSGIAKIGILILDIVCLVIAVMLILNPLVVTLALPILVGWFAILFGIVQLVQGLRFSS